MRAFNPKQRCVTEIESLLLSRVLTWTWSWRLAASTDCRFFTVNVNVPLKELGHPNWETSTQTHHSRYAIPSRCIIAALWPKYFHHAGTITARSDCLELNKRSRGGFWAYNPFWMRCRSWCRHLRKAWSRWACLETLEWTNFLLYVFNKTLDLTAWCVKTLRYVMWLSLQGSVPKTSVLPS